MYGRGSGRIHLSHVSCNGSETDIYQCPYTQSKYVCCDHDDDASVRCQSGKNKQSLNKNKIIDNLI